MRFYKNQLLIKHNKKEKIDIFRITNTLKMSFKSIFIMRIMNGLLAIIENIEWGFK